MGEDFIGNIIITNNPLVKDYFNNILYVEGTMEEVLIKVRDLVHKGHRIISHPLPGSLKIIVSPIRSVVLSNKSYEVDLEQLMLIENSIVRFRQHRSDKGLDFTNEEDYKKLDLELLKSALGE